MSNKTQREYENYKRIINETNALVRRIKNKHWERFPKEMEHDFYGFQKEIERLIRGQRKEVKDLIESKHIENDTWIDYLKKFYTEKQQIKIEPDTPEIITNEEVKI